MWNKSTATDALLAILEDSKAEGKYPSAVAAVKELNSLYNLADSSNINGKLARKINIKINSLGLPPIEPEPNTELLSEPSTSTSTKPEPKEVLKEVLKPELPSITYPKE